MRAHLRPLCLGLLLLVPCLTVAGELSPYFPGHGKRALEQKLQEVKHPALVLAFALQPGDEDFAALAYLRVFLGARVVSVYVTNGEGTPSDRSGGSPARLMGERREEAYHAMTQLGCECYFLNARDPGVVEQQGALARVWSEDSLEARVSEVVRLFPPEMILVQRDMRENDTVGTARRFLLRAITNALHLSTTGATPVVYVDEGNDRQPINVDGNVRHPLWRMPCAEIAARARRLYATLKIVLNSGAGTALRGYSIVGRPKGIDRLTFERGAAAVPSLLADAGRAARSAAEAACRLAKDPALGQLRGGINLLERFSLSPAGLAFAPAEKRMLMTWRSLLEEIRYILLGVNIGDVFSDSILTVRQLAFLKIAHVRPAEFRKNTLIVFPQLSSQNGWYVNEALHQEYSLDTISQFRVLTPGEIDLNFPSSLHGHGSATARTLLTYVFVHRDPDPRKNFVHRVDVPLRMGPRRSFEFLTPVVRVMDDDPLVFTMINVSRDTFKGDVYVADSLVTSPRAGFVLKGKDTEQTDTLRITWKSGLPEGEYEGAVRLGKVTEEPFLGRKFEARVDTARLIGVITGIRGSIVVQSLRRLQARVTLLDPAAVRRGIDTSIRTLVIDRDAFSLLAEQRVDLCSLLPWIAAGGSVVVLPQFNSASVPCKEFQRVGFSRAEGFAAAAEINADTLHPLLCRPNAIPSADWDGWVIARSFGVLRVGEGEAMETPVTAGAEHAGLVCTERFGSGRITYVALDLLSQLMNMHPGSFRLLGNLVSY